MAHRLRLQENMENLARKKQQDYEKQQSWLNKIEYYKHWDKQNNKYQNWTSDQYYENSLGQFDEEKKKREKEDRLIARRDKLRKMLQQEELEYSLEITESPREKTRPQRKELSTEELLDVNIGLKLAEEDRRRHEAELKLYNQWRNENPIVRNYETNQNRASLKLAWLDQQIEKRMAQEKSEKETQKMIQHRKILLKEEEELEKIELEEKAQKEQELITKIKSQMDEYKNNEKRNEKLMMEVEADLRKRREIDDMIEKRQQEIRKRNEKDIVLFNINQSKLKLRKKAVEIQEELQKEKIMIEDLEKLKISEVIDNSEKKQQTKKAMQSYLKYVDDQQRLEQQRQQYMSFIFDSEAKMMWQKQEKIWKIEQETRDKLLNDVLQGIKLQVEEKIQKSLDRQKSVQAEKEENIKIIEDVNKKLKQQQEDMQRRKCERRQELEKQINEKEIKERELELQEQKRKIDELETIRKEEERLKNELMQLQRSRYHPARFTKRNMFW